MSKVKRLKEFTVDCSKWARGGIGGAPRLLNKEGNMCCLGFACEAFQQFVNAENFPWGELRSNDRVIDFRVPGVWNPHSDSLPDDAEGIISDRFIEALTRSGKLLKTCNV